MFLGNVGTDLRNHMAQKPKTTPTLKNLNMPDPVTYKARAGNLFITVGCTGYSCLCQGPQKNINNVVNRK
jgi:hypothetical protein